MSRPELKVYHGDAEETVLRHEPYDDYRMDPSARALAFALICVVWTVLCWALIIGGYYWFLRDALS
jgi:hypothetical protein